MTGAGAFRRGYALAALLLFAVEAGIARFVHDSLIRPFGGDTLAVVLLYCVLRVFPAMRVVPAALAALLIAFAIEFGQYFHLARLLGLSHIAIARLILGSSFDVGDLFAYALGAAGVLIVEAIRASRT